MLPKTSLRKKQQHVKYIGLYCCSFIVLCGIFLGVLFLFNHENTQLLLPAQVHASAPEKDAVYVIKEVERLLQQYKLSYDKIAVTEDNAIIVFLTDGIEAVLTPDRTIEQQITSLQLTIEHFTIVGKRVSRVDVRFEKPITQ